MDALCPTLSTVGGSNFFLAANMRAVFLMTVRVIRVGGAIKSSAAATGMMAVRNFDCGTYIQQ
jgi:hypothetical protein